MIPLWIDELLEIQDRTMASIKLSKAFMKASDNERKIVAIEWNYNREWLYPAFERLSCRKGEKTEPKDRIITSLILDSLEKIIGTREHLIALSATYRACELVSLSPDDVFISVAKILPENDGDILKAFIKRPPEDRNISAFGLVEKETKDGEIEIHFDKTWG